MLDSGVVFAGTCACASVDVDSVSVVNGLSVIRSSAFMYPSGVDAGRRFSIDLSMLPSAEAKGNKNTKDGLVEMFGGWMCR